MSLPVRNGLHRTAGQHNETIIDKDRDDAAMSSPRLLSNRYEIDETLGYGGMSEVHRGRDIRLGRDVAVKVLRADLARDPTFQLRFRREAQNAAALNHPAIVAVYDTGETDSENGPLPYIVMEYVDGRTLRDMVKSEGPLTPRRAMEVMADASAALDFSHRHGIVHRDVKPANIMINESGAVKVMDFGIARALADGQAAVTQTAAVIGTAQYLSPEQARGESVDARSDVYASGCVLFELVTGDPPFTGDSPVAVAYQHVREEPRKPSDVNPQVPAALDAVVLKALSKNPANRYQSAAEMRADLVRVLSGQRPKAPLVMSEEERTSMFAAGGGTTEVMPQRRHRADPLDDPPRDDYRDEYPPRRKRRRGWLVALLTVLAVVAVAAAALVTNNILANREPDKVAVPNVAGQPIQNARSQLSSQGWNLGDIESCPSSRDDIDTVIWQKPQAGAQVVKDETTITLCKGVGPEQVQIPDLTGKSFQEAYQILVERGLRVDQSEQVVEDLSMVDKVVGWNPQGTVDKQTVVTVVIGKEPEQAEVPDVRNQPFEAAKKQLTEAGFTVNRVERDSDKPPNTVVEQNPSGGTMAKLNSQVTLFVSNGKQITMPPLEGMSPKDAEKLLKSRGWEGDIVEEDQPTTDPNLDGKVVSSSPSPGQGLSKNETVTLYVGEYDSSSSETSPPTDGGIFPPFGT